MGDFYSCKIIKYLDHVYPLSLAEENKFFSVGARSATEVALSTVTVISAFKCSVCQVLLLTPNKLKTLVFCDHKPINFTQ